MGVHAAAKVTVSGLLVHQVLQGGADVFAVNGPRVLVRFPGGQKRQQAERRAGDVILVAETCAIAVSMLVKSVQRPVAIGCLMQNEPSKPGSHGGFGFAVAAPFLHEPLTGGGAAAAEAARYIEPAQAAGKTERIGQSRLQ